MAVELSEDGGATTLSIAWAGHRSGAFAVTTFGFIALAVVATTCDATRGDKDAFEMGMGALICFLGALFGGYMALASWLNTTRVSVSSRGLVVTRGPLRFFADAGPELPKRGIRGFVVVRRNDYVHLKGSDVKLFRWAKGWGLDVRLANGSVVPLLDRFADRSDMEEVKDFLDSYFELDA